MSLKSEIEYKLIFVGKECRFDAAFYFHLLNLDVEFE